MYDVDISASVTQINEYIKNLIENDENLRYVYVHGEISNWKVASNGHAYFYLKDEKSIISAVIFSDYLKKLAFNPKDGDEVKALCSLSAYPPRGTYSLRVYEMNAKGEGQILLELEKLKKQLQKEGLFDVSRKKEINIYPKAVGVITALNSAAQKDIVTNLKRRYPIADIYIFPSAVQGDNAPKELKKALLKAQEYPLDTLIIGRGGGASEDLSAFNDEALVRAAAESKIPIISAVGHEIDVTLLDLVADKRASTPTGAAELATIDQREIEQLLSETIEGMKKSFKNRLTNIEKDIATQKDGLNSSMNNILKSRTRELALKKERFISLSPLGILSRGYSITTSKSGIVIKSIKQLTGEDEITTIVFDGTITSTVKKVKESK